MWKSLKSIIDLKDYTAAVEPHIFFCDPASRSMVEVGVLECLPDQLTIADDDDYHRADAEGHEIAELVSPWRQNLQWIFPWTVQRKI